MFQNRSFTFILLFLFLPFGALIDILTGVSLRGNPDRLTIGAVIRTIIMFLLSVYIIYTLRKQRKLLYLYMSTIVTILFSIIVNIFLKANVHLFAEVNFALKTMYFVTMIFTVITLRRKQIKASAAIRKAVQLTAIITGSSYWIAILTNTSANSYTTGANGEIGWFFAANEQSVILIIILGLTLHELIKQPDMLTWTGLLFLSSMLPMIGTKTSLVGGSMLVSAYLLYLFVTVKGRKIFSAKNQHMFSYLFFFALYLSFSFYVTTGSGLFNANERIDAPNEQAKEETDYVNHLLSAREIYVRDGAAEFMQAKIMRKAFGFGYGGEDGKMIEMDFFELFFSYGIIGTIIILTPACVLLLKHVRLPRDGAQFILMLTLLLTLGISFFAGHVLFAPAVMGPVAYLLFLVCKREETDVHV